MKITAALQTHRAAIELCANERLKLEPGETEITSAARHQARPHYRDVAGARWRNDCCPYGCDGMATALGSGLSCWCARKKLGLNLVSEQTDKGRVYRIKDGKVSSTAVDRVKQAA